ncbi:uncharacterized protein LOC108024469 isoform X1 [Drosophila biarmipes]|uniref:uncharacterized protein LOC108024469 isoform X1 n=1 Tax=Drosophila biarmipes TaxID=125945 RepID=UPI0007E89B54|nr:uncharacterized protein LOC108024469 isoform X1 [Drosophila biarmipes]
MKAYVTVCLIFGFVLSSGNAACPETEDVVWALGHRLIGCQNFRNKCYFEEAKYSVFNITTKEECQKYCLGLCPLIRSPTTGKYRGDTKVFINDCLRRYHNCRTGETYIKNHAIS